MAKSKGYHRPGGYIRRYEEMLASPAYRDLSTYGRCLLEEFQRTYRPGRNGKLSISTKHAAERINISEPTASNAFYELIDHGFIVLTKGQLWQERKAREWRLTFEPGAKNQEPTDEWMQWEPVQNKTRPKKQGQDCSKNRGRLLKKQGQSTNVVKLSH